MVSVTVCKPDSGAATDCATINNVLLDTGSFGLRLFGSAIESANSSTLSALTQQTSSGETVAECAFFGSGYTWGTVRNADIKLSSEVATDVPIQVITDPTFTGSSPGDCQVSSEISTASDLGANGILGIGVARYDCSSSSACASDYYACNGSACTAISQATTSQVQNPVASFTTDNNGVIVELAQVSDSGAASATGTLVFGIDTESNNALAGTSATTLATDDFGDMSATYDGTTYSDSAYLDSGSNGIFFPNSTGLATYSDWYAPSTTQGLSATLTDANSKTTTIDFNIGNAETFFDAGYYASNSLGGTASGQMDFGLSYFYGRYVYYGIVNKSSTGGGTGPYVSYVSS